jgi:hypothetical protein
MNVSGLVLLVNGFQIVRTLKLPLKLLRHFGYVDYIIKTSESRIVSGSPNPRMFSFLLIGYRVLVIGFSFKLNKFLSKLILTEKPLLFLLGKISTYKWFYYESTLKV